MADLAHKVLQRDIGIVILGPHAVQRTRPQVPVPDMAFPSERQVHALGRLQQFVGAVETRQRHGAIGPVLRPQLVEDPLCLLVAHVAALDAIPGNKRLRERRTRFDLRFGDPCCRISVDRRPQHQVECAVSAAFRQSAVGLCQDPGA